MIDVHVRHTAPELVEHNKKDGFPCPEWSIEKHIEFNNKVGITKSILSSMWLDGDKETDLKFCGIMNNQGAELHKKYPDMFEFFATIPAASPKEAVEEIKRAYDMGAVGATLFSNHGGKYLGHPDMEPMWEELDKRNAVVFMHPSNPDAYPKNCSTAKVMAMFELIADSSRAIVDMTISGVFTRHPNVKIIVSHLGGFLPYAIKRANYLLQVMRMNGAKVDDVNLDEVLSHIYFDVAGFIDDSFMDMLLTLTDTDHILYGSDYYPTPTPVVIDQINRLKNNKRVAGKVEDILDNNAKKLFNL